MKSYPAPPIPETIIEAVRWSVEGGASQDEVIALMRREGLGMVPSIRLLARFFHLTSSEAKLKVHFSETWSDCLKSNEALHDAAIAALEELKASDAGSAETLQETR